MAERKGKRNHSTREKKHTINKCTGTKGQKRSRLADVLACIILSVICCVALDGFMTSAHGNTEEDPETFKVYESITIEAGDTLWGLAEEYRSSEESTIEYIHTLKAINNLTENTIRAGDKIIVVYNNTFKE